jgi:hypothetical protein
MSLIIKAHKSYSFIIKFFIYLWDWSGTESTITASIYWPILQPWMIDVDDFGAVSGVHEARSTGSTPSKPAPLPLCPPQIPHDLTQTRTRSNSVGTWRSTA